MKLVIVSVGFYDQTMMENNIFFTDIQSSRNWLHLVVADCAGKDSETKITLGYGKSRIIYERSGRNYDMGNTVYAIEQAKERIDPEDVLCFVNLDDHFFGCDALKTVEGVYRRHPETMVTWGSYYTISGAEGKFSVKYSDWKNLRSSQWGFSHLRTMRYGLFQAIPDKELRDDDGDYFKVCSDMALMYPAVEFAGRGRARFIEKKIYLYNDMNPMNDHRANRDAQIAAERTIRGRKPMGEMKWK